MTPHLLVPAAPAQRTADDLADLEALQGALRHAQRVGDDEDAVALLRAMAYVHGLHGEPEVALALRQHAARLRQQAVSPGLDITCFGPFEVLDDGRPVSLAALRPRARAVLRLLALHAGRPVHREALLAALWPEADAVAAGRSLQTTVSSLRAVLAGSLAGEALVREDGAYRLTAAVSTDVERADRALERAAALRGTSPELAAAAYEGALDLYAGDLLEEEGPAEWVVEHRSAWRVRITTAAGDLARLELQRGRPTAAARAARRGLAVDRLVDGLWRVLVEALHADGDVATAHAATQEYDALLQQLDDAG